LDLYLRTENRINPLNQKFYGCYTIASDLKQIESLVPAKMRSYVQLGYLLNRNTIIDPISFSSSIESGRSYQKASIELNYKYSYIGKENGLELRVFAGTMIKSDISNPYYSLSASGRSSTELYMYEGVFPGRFIEFPKTFFSRQMSLSEGGLVSTVNDSLGYSRWLCSVSLTSSLPGIASKIPVKPFFNLLLNDHGISSMNKSIIFYEAGLKAGIWDLFEVYFPFIVSDNISMLRGSLKERIRFIFRLDKMNPFKLKT